MNGKFDISHQENLDKCTNLMIGVRWCIGRPLLLVYVGNTPPGSSHTVYCDVLNYPNLLYRDFSLKISSCCQRTALSTGSVQGFGEIRRSVKLITGVNSLCAPRGQPIECVSQL